MSKPLQFFTAGMVKYELYNIKAKEDGNENDHSQGIGGKTE